MSKLFKPANLLMYLLVILVFFMAGMVLAGTAGAAKGQGLAGGSIIFGYGVFAAFIAFIVSLFVVHKAKINTIVKINKIFGILLLIAVCLIIYRVITINKSKNPEKELPTKTTTQEPKDISMVSYKTSNKPILVEQNSKSSIGIGFFKPNYFEYPTLYFFDDINLEKGLMEHLPTDSVVFANDKYNNPTTTYAPPWLYPEHLKLDYGIITFKVVGIGRDFVKVEANKKTKQVTYLDKYKGTFVSWPDFILSANSVEFNENGRKKVFVRPMDYAGEVNVEYSFIKPILVEEDWMYVKLVNENFVEQGKGWIRWKKDNILLITYSLLS